MKSKISFTSAIFFTVVMTASLLTGCSKPTPLETNTTSNATPTASVTNQTAATTTAPTETLKEFSFATSDHYADPVWGEKYAEAFFKDTGVKMNLINIPNDKWEEKLSSLLMSGDIPDVFRGDGKPYQYVKQEFIVPLDDYLSSNSKMKKLVDENPVMKDPFIIDGKIYGITFSRPQVMVFWLRDDLLKKADMPLPKSMTELMDTFRFLKKQDINNNGKDDTIALTLGSSVQVYDCIAAAFGTRMEIFKKDGKFIDPIVTEEYKEFIDFMKNLYTEGILDKEFPNQGYSQTRTKIYTGAAASIIMWDNTYSGFVTNMAKNNVEGTMAAVPPFKTDKGGFGTSFYPPNGSAMYISSECKYPKEVFDVFFDWNLLSENGIIYGSRGIPDYNFTVVDGTLIPTEKGGVGFHGQHFPTYFKDFVYPFKMDELTIKQVEVQEKARADYFANQSLFETIEPPTDYLKYWDIRESINGSTGKVAELAYGYWIGQINYEEFMASYTKFASETDIPGMINELNK